MIVTLLMTLEGSNPEVSRCVNVDDSLDLTQLAEVIDAAFGFSGAASHLFITGSGKFRQVFSESPGAGEADESEVFVSKFTDITYIYDPTANWNIRVEALGPSELGGPTPLLVDAAGPDIIESANGPELMTKFRHEARRIAAGLPPNMEVTPLLLSFLPVMSPERMLDRLTIADPVTVATRVSYIAEELFYDPVDQPPRPHAPTLADEFGQFLDSRPDLQAILEDDPYPDQNPTLLAAVSDFFDQRPGPHPSGLVPPGGRDHRDDGDLDDNVILFPGAVEDNEPDFVDRFPITLRALIGLFLEPVQLTKTGKMPVATIREMMELLHINSRLRQPRENTFPSVYDVRLLLVGGGFVEEREGALVASELGRMAYEFFDTGLNIAEWAAGFEHAFGEEEWKAVLWALADWYSIGGDYGITPPPFESVPEKTDLVFRFLVDLGAIEVAPQGSTLTGSAYRMLQRILSLYVHGH
ncbi:hypothetical protein V6D40_09575 [Corynebacterium sp. Q4381]|uniref:IS1096 element passenger TnpR family protein n=1 Tax=Corynebacterium sp. Marseille-Q4381 TaxID=3121597 RepID=UPI002FE6ACB0